jgi:DNA replication protein DnaC
MSQEEFYRERRLEEIFGSTYRGTKIDKLPNPKLTKYILEKWRRDDVGEYIPECRQEVADYDQAKDSWGWEKPGLVFVGEPGTGKTRSAFLLFENLTKQGCELCGIHAVKWASATSRKAKECKLDQWLEETLAPPNYGETASMLLLDDLDKGRFTETVQAELFNLIETATASGVPMLITMNTSGAELLKKFDGESGKAVVRRIREFCTVVDFNKGKV